MELFIKRFDELSTEELYEIYKLRVSVFVVEQNCPYQEVDAADKKAYHLWFSENGKMIAYLRVLPAGVTFAEASIGRVISIKRRQGLGNKILGEGIRVAKEILGAESIRIEAQVWVKSLYEKAGFVAVSEEFLEDGIPHIEMLKKF